MATYPDLARSGVLFMDFFIHVTGGYGKVSRFWRARGWDDNTAEVVFASYSRNKVRHSIVIEWRRAHKNCTDVRISVDSLSPSQLGIKKGKRLRFSTADLAAFFTLIKAQKLPSGVVAHFGFMTDLKLLPDMHAKGLRVTNMTMEAGEGTENPIKIHIRQADTRALVTVEPESPFPFKEDPAEFFNEVLGFARTIGAGLRGNVLHG